MSGMADVLAEGKELRRSHVPVLFGVLAVHGVVGWALLSISAVRDAVIDVVPVMIATIIESRPDPEPYIPPPPASPQLELTPLPLLNPLVVQAEVAVAPAEKSVAQTMELAAITDINAPVRPREAVPPLKTIPASAVEYLVMPKPVYPLYSKRARETGTVMLRVLINEKGMPAHIEVEASSGYPRLDAAAVTAMQGARFKPYSENGIALAVWAPAPIIFEL